MHRIPHYCYWYTDPLHKISILHPENTVDLNCIYVFFLFQNSSAMLEVVCTFKMPRAKGYSVSDSELSKFVLDHFSDNLEEIADK